MEKKDHGGTAIPGLYEIQSFLPGDETELEGMIRMVFDEYVGCEYSTQGNEIFYDFIRADKIRERIEAGNILLTAKVHGEIVGMIEVRDCNHICLFFVQQAFQGRHIGRALFSELLHRLKGKTVFMEVNSSPYAVPIYEALGFAAAGPQTEHDGIKFLPMRMEI